MAAPPPVTPQVAASLAVTPPLADPPPVTSPLAALPPGTPSLATTRASSGESSWPSMAGTAGERGLRVRGDGAGARGEGRGGCADAVDGCQPRCEDFHSLARRVTRNKHSNRDPVTYEDRVSIFRQSGLQG